MRSVLFVWILLVMGGRAITQVPVEVFSGHKKTTADIMFFKFFKKKDGQNSEWLFFNRTRASIDYTMTPQSNLPQFGFTEAVSYNNKKWKGFAPVALVQILNRGVYPKAGIQFASSKNDYTLFSWLVSETKARPGFDFFLLARYTPVLNPQLRLFAQVELVNAFPTSANMNFNFVQRLRLGIKRNAFQVGAGADITENGRTTFLNTVNIGGFLRYEF